MLVAPYKDGAYSKTDFYVAVDSVGAGVSDVVLLAGGSAARISDDDQEKPIDMKIVGIVDEVDVGSVEIVSGSLI